VINSSTFPVSTQCQYPTRREPIAPVNAMNFGNIQPFDRNILCAMAKSFVQAARRNAPIDASINRPTPRSYYTDIGDFQAISSMVRYLQNLLRHSLGSSVPCQGCVESCFTSHFIWLQSFRNSQLVFRDTSFAWNYKEKQSVMFYWQVDSCDPSLVLRKTIFQQSTREKKELV